MVHLPFPSLLRFPMLFLSQLVGFEELCSPPQALARPVIITTKQHLAQYYYYELMIINQSSHMNAIFVYICAVSIILNDTIGSSNYLPPYL